MKIIEDIAKKINFFELFQQKEDSKSSGIVHSKTCPNGSFKASLQ
jgi:hypothetical protein